MCDTKQNIKVAAVPLSRNTKLIYHFNRLRYNRVPQSVKPSFGYSLSPVGWH